MKAIIQILRTILTLLWLLLLAGDIFLLTSAGDPPQALGYTALAIEDAAMEPELHPGDLALIKMDADPQPGDVVYYQGPQGPALGRILGTSEEQFIVRADNDTADGALLAPEAIDGVLSSYLPDFAAPADFLRSPAGVSVIVLLGAVLILLPGLLLRTPAPRRGSRGGYTARH